MEKIWKYLMTLANGVGRARAATHFTRMGRPDLARRIMLED